MNFAKYIVAHNLTKFKYFEKQIIFSILQLTGFKMIHHLSAFYKFASHQNFQK